jgi:porin-like protein
MDDGTLSAKITAAVVMATLLAAAIASGASAQTTTAKTRTGSDKPDSKWSVPAPKAAPAKRATLCSQYGEGFVPLPGTDTCVRAGGYIRTEISR